MKQKTIDKATENAWGLFAEIYPKLIRFDPPQIILCNKLTRTAGKCYFWQNRVKLANKFFANNEAYMLAQILPHELAHQIDYNLFRVKKDCDSLTHGKLWQQIMLNYGIPANKYHSLKI